MGPFDLDFSHVQNVVAPPDRIPVLGNEHRMVRVAFDLFRLDGDDEERLWQVQTAEDGNEFLVRTYDLPEDVEDGLESRSADWSVMADSKLANLTVAYKGVPIHRLAAADYGAWSPDEVRMLRQLVSEKLASDKAWAARFLQDLPSAKLAALRETFPEFSKIALDLVCPVCGESRADCTCAKRADDPAGFPPPEGLVEAYERLRDALEAQGGYSALSEEQKDRFNAAADKIDEIKLPGASLDEQSAKALLSELTDLIEQFEQGAERSAEGWPPKGENIHQIDRRNPDEMYNLAYLAAHSAPDDIEIARSPSRWEIGNVLDKGGMVLVVGTEEWSGGFKPATEYWFVRKGAGPKAADDPMAEKWERQRKEREEEQQRFRTHQLTDLREQRISKMWHALSDETRDRIVPGWREMPNWRAVLDRLQSEETLQALREMAGEAGYQAPEPHGYAEEIEHFDRDSADDMYKLAAMGLPYTLQWIDNEMQYTTDNLRERVEAALKRGLKVVRVSRGGAPPSEGSIWYFKSIGMQRADDKPLDDTLRKQLWDLRTKLSVELAGRVGIGEDSMDRLSDEEKAAFTAAAKKLNEAEKSGSGLEEAAALVEQFEKTSPPQELGRLEEGTRRLFRMVRQREMSAIGRLKEIAMKMGQGGHYERHELPMVVFYFHDGIGGEEKAKEFLAEADRIGYYGTLVGPGYAAVKLPGL